MRMSTELTSAPLPSARPHAVRRLAARYGILISFLAISVALSFANQHFLSTGNILNVLRQISINGVLAIGMTFVIITGGIDLSIGSMLALSGMVAASLVTGAAPHSAFLAVAAALFVGGLFGAVNGLLIARFSVPAFVATLGMLSVARGGTLLYSDGRPIPNLTPEFRWIGQGVVFGVPVPAIIFLVVLLVAWIVLTHTVYGRWVYAVGGNIKSARTSGINTRLIVFSVYVIMGVLAGLAGLILTARTTSALPQAGLGYELDAIAAVVIGGTSLIGGVGSVLYTLIGTLIIGVLNNGLDLMGVSSYYQQVTKGAIIVLAVLIDRSRQQNP
jgi:putative xylitol transport system permease protein